MFFETNLDSRRWFAAAAEYSSIPGNSWVRLVTLDRDSTRRPSLAHAAGRREVFLCLRRRQLPPFSFRRTGLPGALWLLIIRTCNYLSLCSGMPAFNSPL